MHLSLGVLSVSRHILHVLLAAWLMGCFAMPAMAEISSVRQKELVHLVRQDCGSCHGMLLTGGLGLPLTPQALRDKPFEGLVATVYYGRPGTAMPPWRSIITEQEAEWIVRQLMAGFPSELQ